MAGVYVGGIWFPAGFIPKSMRSKPGRQQAPEVYVNLLKLKKPELFKVRGK